MITCWDKTGKIIHQDQNDADFQMWEADTSVYGIKQTKESFPELGWILTTDGVYRPLTNTEKTKTVPPQLVLASTQKIVVNEDGTDYVAELTVQEQINAKVISIDDVRKSAYIRISNEIDQYLITARTKNSYLVNDAAQKICTLTFALQGLTDAASTALKTSLTSAGLIYSVDQASEILSFLISVKAARDAACKDIKSASNAAAIEAVSFANYL